MATRGSHLEIFSTPAPPFVHNSPCLPTTQSVRVDLEFPSFPQSLGFARVSMAGRTDRNPHGMSLAAAITQLVDRHHLRDWRRVFFDPQCIQPE